MRRGTTFILLAVLCWGLLGVMARVAMADGTPPLTVAFWRASLAAMLFTAHATVTSAKPLRHGDRGSAVFLGVAGVAVFYLAYLNSVDQGGAALASILLYSAPIWVAIGGRMLFAERLTRRAVVALALTVIGVVVVALASGASDVRVSAGAVSWGLLSGATYALYYLVGRRLFSHNASARVMSWALGIGSLAMLPFVQFQQMSAAGWASIAFLAVVCTYAAYLAYAEGVRRLPAARAATIATLEPVIAVIAAYVVWNERLSPLGVVGAVTVIGGVLLSASSSAWNSVPVSSTDGASPRQPANP